MNKETLMKQKKDKISKLDNILMGGLMGIFSLLFAIGLIGDYMGAFIFPLWMASGLFGLYVIMAFTATFYTSYKLHKVDKEFSDGE